MRRLAIHRLNRHAEAGVLTPLLDVLFILLLFMLSTLVWAEDRLGVPYTDLLPEANAPVLAGSGVVIAIDSSFLYVGGKPVLALSAIEELGPNEWFLPALHAALQEVQWGSTQGGAVELSCVLLAPAGMRYGLIAPVLYTISQAGFERVSLLVRPMGRKT